MRSGTSFYNSTLYRKNLARFWPIWAVYGVFWIFLMPLQFLTVHAQYSGTEFLTAQLSRQAAEPLYMLESGVSLSAAVGLAAAMAVFSYLFFARSACMMHSLPLNRNSLFVTNYLSGLSFILLPHLAIFLMTAAVEAMYGCLNLNALAVWLLVQSVTALFFYSFAVFCAMFTGHILALPAFYGILNLLVYVILSLMDTVLQAVLYGFSGLRGDIEQVTQWFTPLIKLSSACTVRYVETAAGEWVRGTQINNPGAVAFYAAAAVALTLAALWVYHKRHVESSGDVVAISLVRPVFKYGVAVCSGLAFGVLTVAILGMESEILLFAASILWAVVGYFAAEMLLKKSFRVFRAWKGAVVLAALLCLLFTAVSLDWFGYEDRIPDPDQVTQVHLRSFGMGVPYDSLSYANAQLVTDPDHIRLFSNLHQAIIMEKNRQNTIGDEYISLWLEYTLADGSVLERRYNSIPINEDEMPIQGSAANTAAAVLADRKLVWDMYGFDELIEDEDARLVEAHLYRMWDWENQRYQEHYLTPADLDLNQLWQAVLQDFDEGNIGVRYLFGGSSTYETNVYTAELTFLWDIPEDRPDTKPVDLMIPQEVYSTAVSYSRDFSITLTPHARHTLTCLEKCGFSQDDFVTVQERRILLDK